MKPTPQKEFMPQNTNPAHTPWPMRQQVTGPVGYLYYCAMLLHKYLCFSPLLPPYVIHGHAIDLSQHYAVKNLRPKERNASCSLSCGQSFKSLDFCVQCGMHIDPTQTRKGSWECVRQFSFVVVEYLKKETTLGRKSLFWLSVPEGMQSIMAEKVWQSKCEVGMTVRKETDGLHSQREWVTEEGTRRVAKL